MKRYLADKDTQMANKQKKRFSTSLDIRNKPIKTTVSYHYTPIRTAKIKKKKIVTVPNAGKEIQKLDYSYITDSNDKGTPHREIIWKCCISQTMQ